MTLSAPRTSNPSLEPFVSFEPDAPDVKVTMPFTVKWSKVTFWRES